MAVALGKRKRPAEQKRTRSVKQEREPDEDDATARELLKKAFEAKFAPLEVQPIESSTAADSDGQNEDDSDAESDWSGLTGEDEEDRVEVIEHTVPTIDSIFDGSAKKYLSSKPPTLGDDEESATKQASKSNKSKTGDGEEDGSEATNLKHDLALQRLLKESHLLDASSFSSSTAPEGKSRVKALDMRLQDLGAKTSALQQDKMPMHIRRGISGKAASREASRRKEAAENGVILEKARMNAPKAQQKRRERGVGGVGIGRMSGSTLKLSDRDVRSIEGRRGSGTGRRGGKRR
ncbi:hypothetical protein CKM354_001086400 [Cercospora kikuchii]|uniref:Protein FAF1 n=1 Tax=Cercospora kikuchii TaxID=84275 RepID=A0A9P3CSD9_9PEZI|nr:uncharacterized protein CKM354_001086400 [Cercospora kikuchii]GIZ47781.1 hypothetical protein CKM354_001086400 [Cercospora kikuchii]